MVNLPAEKISKVSTLTQLNEIFPNLHNLPIIYNHKILNLTNTKFNFMGKTALVLSGGGFRGAFQAGALKVLKENWNKIEPGEPEFKFNIVAGVSAGALNGLLVAQNKFDELLELWNSIGENGVEEIYTSDFIDTHFDKSLSKPKIKFKFDWNNLRKHFPKTTRNIVFKALFNRKNLFHTLEDELYNFKSLADNSNLFQLIKKYARKEFFEECSYKCGYVSLNTGDFYSVDICDFETDEDFAKGVLASSAMPTVWPPVDKIRVNGAVHEQCVDGGIRNVSPLRAVIEDIKKDSNPDEYTIIIINCSTGKIQPENFAQKNIAQIGLRSLIDIAITEIFNNDIREFLTKNHIVKQIEQQHPGEVIYDFDFENRRTGKPLVYFKSILIQPDDNVLGDTLTATKKQIRERIEHGIYKADLALNIHKKTDKNNRMTIV